MKNRGRSRAVNVFYVQWSMDTGSRLPSRVSRGHRAGLLPDRLGERIWPMRRKEQKHVESYIKDVYEAINIFS
jgi:hypothetical protein